MVVSSLRRTRRVGGSANCCDTIQGAARNLCQVHYLIIGTDIEVFNLPFMGFEVELLLQVRILTKTKQRNRASSESPQ